MNGEAIHEFVLEYDRERKGNVFFFWMKGKDRAVVVDLEVGFVISST